MTEIIGEAIVTATRSSSSTEYVVTGTREQVADAIAAVERAYHPAGYGTWFNWPPGRVGHDGAPLAYKAPVEVGPGVWRALGHRSNSCD